MNTDMAAETTVVVLGTGGTIAGAAASAEDEINYRAGQLGIEQLVASLPASLKPELLLEQVAQIDSKDADFAFWRQLALRCAHWLRQPQVRALVLTHGTDTLEETAFFLSRMLDSSKPVVLTCAMRPATAIAPDGPPNLRDAILLAADPGARGVLAVCAGDVHSALDLQKVHTYRLNPFSSGDAGPVARFDKYDDTLRWLREAASTGDFHGPIAVEELPGAERWPPVEIVMNCAGVSGMAVRALVQAGVQGLVAAGTGNGTLGHELETALRDAQAAGVRVVRASRCTDGGVRPRADDPFEPSHGLSAVKARIALLLDLLARGGRANGPG